MQRSLIVVKRSHILILCFLWLLLAARVITFVVENGTADWNLVALAFFAWSGGMVTQRLYDVAHDMYGERA